MLVAISKRVHIPEEELILRLKKKDESAFQYLYDNYSGALMGISLRLMKDRDLAEEVVHDAFIKVWKNVKDYDSSRGRLYTWMARICRNCALDRLKSKRHKNSAKTDTIGYDVPTGDSWSQKGMNVDTIGVKDWLSALNDDQKNVFEAVYFQGMSHSQASEDLDTPLGTIKTRLRTGLLAIRQKLGIE